MQGDRVEFGGAVTAVLESLGWTPEQASEALGIKLPTLQAMCQGIAPMRSLVIRFAETVAPRLRGDPAAPAWWRDVDAWLQAAGYPPRREMSTPAPRPPVPRQLSGASDSGRGVPPPDWQGPASTRPTVPRTEPAAPAEPRAAEIYHPRWEPIQSGDTTIHVFWILNAQEEKVFRITLAAREDRFVRARQVKDDLARMSQSQFERRYGRWRIAEQRSQ